VYGFSVANTPTFRGYGWDVLTTSAWRTDPELVQLAQQHGAQVELNAGDVLQHMSSNRTREAWVSALATKFQGSCIISLQSAGLVGSWTLDII
jgi:hypothetical protein